jgi:hypothetical protein
LEPSVPCEFATRFYRFAMQQKQPVLGGRTVVVYPLPLAARRLLQLSIYAGQSLPNQFIAPRPWHLAAPMGSEGEQ